MTVLGKESNAKLYPVKFQSTFKRPQEEKNGVKMSTEEQNVADSEFQAEATATADAATTVLAATRPAAVANIMDSVSQEDLALLDGGINENIDQSEIKTSRLAIMQSKSPEIDNMTPGYQQGQLIEHINRTILTTYGPAPWLIEQGIDPSKCPEFNYMAFVYVFKLPTEWIKWKKDDERTDGEGLWHFKTTDKNDPKYADEIRRGTWQKYGGTYTEKGAPPVTDNVNHMILPLTPDLTGAKYGPIISSFSRTSSEAGSALSTAIAQLRTMRGLRTFQAIFYLYTTQESFKDKAGKATKSWVLNIAQSSKRADLLCPGVASLAMNTGIGFMKNQSMQHAILNASPPEAGHSDDLTKSHAGRTSNASTTDAFPGEDEEVF